MSLIRYADKEIVGIIQNSDNTVVTVYRYDLLKTSQEKLEFIEAGEEWWWGSNRLLPINIVLKSVMKKFAYCLQTYATKDFEMVAGHLTSLENVIVKIEESDLNKSQINKAIFIDNKNRHELEITIKSRVHSEEVLNLKKYWELILS